jgi:tetratricopeptide (TPR) repeat protein
VDHLLAAAADPALFDTDAEAPELALKLALAFASLRAPASGLPFARWALGFQQREHAMLHVRTAVASFVMAQLLRDAAPPTPETRAEREVFLRRAVGTLRQTRNDDAVLGHALIALGELHGEDGEHDSAVATFEEAVGVAGLTRGPHHPQTLWARAALGGARAQAGHKEAADAVLREALGASRQQSVENGDLLEAILEPLARLSYDLLRLSDHIEFTDELKRVRMLRAKRGTTGPLRDVTPDHLPAFSAVTARQEGSGDRQLAWLG